MSDLITIARVEDIPPGHAARVSVDGTAIAIFNVDGQFHALDDLCSHAEASLSEGELDVEACTVECPLHGSTFDLRTGEPLSLPAVIPVGVHRVTVDDGKVHVQLASP